MLARLQVEDHKKAAADASTSASRGPQKAAADASTSASKGPQNIAITTNVGNPRQSCVNAG